MSLIVVQQPSGTLVRAIVQDETPQDAEARGKAIRDAWQNQRPAIKKETGK